MDEAEPYPDRGPYPDQGPPEQRSAGQQGPAERQRRPERRRQRERLRPEELCPEELSSADQPRPITLAHPVIAGYDGSASARNALAYAAGMARRLDRPLLVAYVTSPGVYCEPLTGQVVGLLRDADALERWLLAELDQVTDPGGLDVHVRTRRGNPARELAAMASEFSADALVIGAPRGFWHHFAGSVPGWLARHAKCPVIVVP
jgi:nucleotide-binding universal stress UspA family protein